MIKEKKEVRAVSEHPLTIRNYPIAGLLSQGQKNLPVPFQREIYLTSFEAAGLPHIEGAKQIVKKLVKEDVLFLFREPDNPYDTCAVVIKNKNGEKLGYLPRRINRIPARLLDAGKELYGKVMVAETDRSIRLRVGLYLKD